MYFVVSTIKGKARELAYMVQRRNVDMSCVQETRWQQGYNPLRKVVSKREDKWCRCDSDVVIKSVLEVKSVR